MQVILTKDIKNIGQAGDIVSVKKGYARNFLLIKNWAVPCTKGSAELARHRQQWIAAKKKKALVERQSLVEKLKDLKLSFVKEASKEGKMFGSLTALDISKELNTKGYEVDKKVIKLEHPLKEVGEHKVALDWGSDIKTNLFIHISPPVTKSSPVTKKKPEEKEEEEKKRGGE